VGEDKREEDLVDRLINRAVLKVWDKYLKVEQLKKVSDHFESGWGVEVSTRCAPRTISRASARSPACARASGSSARSRARGSWRPPSSSCWKASTCHQKLNKDREGGRYTYRA
jgi:hypothetical protein